MSKQTARLLQNQRQSSDPLLLAEQAVEREDFVRAIQIYENMLRPGSEAIAGLVHNLVPLYLKIRKPMLALRAAEALTFFAPRSVDAWMFLANMRERLADWEGALQAIHQVLEINPQHEGAHQSRLFLLSSHAPAEDVRGYHESWAAAFINSQPRLPDPIRPVNPKVHVGYVSGDFHKHVMDRVIEPLLEYHDRSKFNLFAYDTVDRPDGVTRRMKGYTGVHWRSLKGLDVDDAAGCIRADRIDILVDLSGLTFGQRLKVFARRPAPLQVTWNGYLPTTGTNIFDYKLCDETAGSKSDYTEKLWKLPNSLALAPLPGAPAVTELPALKNGYVTFGCVNSYAKVTREAIDAWILILKALPTARLVMVVAGCSDQETAIAVLRRFGPVQERVMLTEWATGMAFPRVFADLDIALNTHPYGGCATSFDTMWQGTPIVCMEGDRNIGRYAAHFMRAVGLHEYVARDWNGYVARAVAAARDLPRLARIRRELRGKLQEHPWFQQKDWVRYVERAYLEMGRG